MALTLFSVPKAMAPPFDIIQHNAVASWARLPGEPRILLFGREPGIAELAADHKAEHIQDVSTSATGTPLLDDVFARARATAGSRWLVFLNTDLVLLNDLPRAISAAEQLGRTCLLVGRRTTVELGPLDFRGDWHRSVSRIARTNGRIDPADHMDYFAFDRDLFSEIPPFAVGRPPYDQWFIWEARREKAAVVDATAAILAIHQQHDYSHVPEGKKGAYQGEEARRNTELAGGWTKMLSMADATHVMDAQYRILRTSLSRRIAARSERTRRWIIDLTRPLRHDLGIRGRDSGSADRS